MGFGPLKVKLLLLKDGISMHNSLLKIALIVEVSKNNVLMPAPAGFCLILIFLPIAGYNIGLLRTAAYKLDSLAQLQVRIGLRLLRRGITAYKQGSA
jgi:hypothetical protein